MVLSALQTDQGLCFAYRPTGLGLVELPSDRAGQRLRFQLTYLYTYYFAYRPTGRVLVELPADQTGQRICFQLTYLYTY